MSTGHSTKTFLSISCFLLAWVLLPLVAGADADNEPRSSYDFCSWGLVSPYPTDHAPSQTIKVFTTFDSGTGPDLFVGGEFNHMGSLTADNIVRWTGVKWLALVEDYCEGIEGTVYALGVFDDGSGPALYVGGRFETVCGVAANNIVKWDGSSWSVLSDATGPGVTADGTDIPYVYVLASYDDGTGEKLYVGGSFANAGGEATTNLATWDGSSWSALPVSGTVKALTVHDDGSGSRLFVGGMINTIGGLTVNHIAAWNGSQWSALSGPAGTGTSGNGGVHTLAVYDDGAGEKLYAGGDFTYAGGVTANHIARWNGIIWSELTGPGGTGLGTGGSGNTVTALAAYNGALYVGGEFYTAGGVHAGKIAAWNGGDWLALADGSEVGIQGSYLLLNALSTYDDGSGMALAVGGHFDQAGSVITDNLACWRCPDMLFGDGFESGDTSAWSPLADEY